MSACWLPALHNQPSRSSKASSCILLQIQQLWSEVLGIERISCSANFFHIGGTSLLAVMLASRLQSCLHIQVPASQLFSSRTISELAGFASQCQPVASQPASQPDDSTGCPQQAQVVPTRLTASQKAQGVYCTLNQEVMVLSHQLCPRPSAFSMPFAARLRGPLDVNLLDNALRLAVSHQEVLLCKLTGKLVSKNFLGRGLRKMIATSMDSNKVAEGLLSNALVGKMIKKRMEGQAGLGTKMVLPLVRPQVANSHHRAWQVSPCLLSCRYQVGTHAFICWG